MAPENLAIAIQTKALASTGGDRNTPETVRAGENNRRRGGPRWRRTSDAPLPKHPSTPVDGGDDALAGGHDNLGLAVAVQVSHGRTYRRPFDLRLPEDLAGQRRESPHCAGFIGLND